MNLGGVRRWECASNRNQLDHWTITERTRASQSGRIRTRPLWVTRLFVAALAAGPFLFPHAAYMKQCFGKSGRLARQCFIPSRLPGITSSISEVGMFWWSGRDPKPEFIRGADDFCDHIWPSGERWRVRANRFDSAYRSYNTIPSHPPEDHESQTFRELYEHNFTAYYEGDTEWPEESELHFPLGNGRLNAPWKPNILGSFPLWSGNTWFWAPDHCFCYPPINLNSTVP